ncbi:olfactory receptor 10A7-like [Pelodytes ibericus]
MSYDRFLAICNPLHYISIMDLRLRVQLVFWSWFLACLVLLFTVFLVCNLKFCGPNIIDHYFCDIEPILELACSDHTIIELSYFVLAILFALIPFTFILYTYISIFITITQISSTRGRHKTFSTCSSHLIVVSIYYGTLITIYMVPSKGQTYNIKKLISLLYTMGTPFLNPIIYSLRNQEIRRAVKYVYNVLTRNYHEQQKNVQQFAFQSPSIKFEQHNVFFSPVSVNWTVNIKGRCHLNIVDALHLDNKIK